MKETITVAIDGPAGSGKSTVAKLVAKSLGIRNVDSGAVYRAVTLLLMNENVDVAAAGQVDRSLSGSKIFLEEGGTGVKVLLNGEDVTADIRSLEVTRNVSRVSENKAVRAFVTDLLRTLSQRRSVVMEGRDIGTVVFPDADVKIYMDASAEERARRRFKELQMINGDLDLRDVEADIRKRDAMDSNRNVAPLCKALDAVTLDTTGLTINEVVGRIVKLVSAWQNTESVVTRKNI